MSKSKIEQLHGKAITICQCESCGKEFKEDEIEYSRSSDLRYEYEHCPFCGWKLIRNVAVEINGIKYDIL